MSEEVAQLPLCANLFSAHTKDLVSLGLRYFSYRFKLGLVVVTTFAVGVAVGQLFFGGSAYADHFQIKVQR